MDVSGLSDKVLEPAYVHKHESFVQWPCTHTPFHYERAITCGSQCGGGSLVWKERVCVHGHWVLNFNSGHANFKLADSTFIRRTDNILTFAHYSLLIERWAALPLVTTDGPQLLNFIRSWVTDCALALEFQFELKFHPITPVKEKRMRLRSPTIDSALKMPPKVSQWLVANSLSFSSLWQGVIGCTRLKSSVIKAWERRKLSSTSIQDFDCESNLKWRSHSLGLEGAHVFLSLALISAFKAPPIIKIQMEIKNIKSKNYI